MCSHSSSLSNVLIFSFYRYNYKVAFSFVLIYHSHGPLDWYWYSVRLCSIGENQGQVVTTRSALNSTRGQLRVPGHFLPLSCLTRKDAFTRSSHSTWDESCDSYSVLLEKLKTNYPRCLGTARKQLSTVGPLQVLPQLKRVASSKVMPAAQEGPHYVTGYGGHSQVLYFCSIWEPSWRIIPSSDHLCHQVTKDFYCRVDHNQWSMPIPASFPSCPQVLTPKALSVFISI